MKFTWITGMAALGFVAAPAYAYDITNETPEQKCQRWAQQTNVHPQDIPHFVKDCLADIKNPLKEGGGDGDE